MLPVVIVGAIGLAVAKSNPVIGLGLLVVSVTAFVSIVVAANATRQVFNLALFRYATGVDTPGFAIADFEDPFLRRGGSGRRTRKWAWIALAIIVGLVALAAIFGNHRRQGTDASGAYSPYWHVTLPATASGEVSTGTPVYFEGRQVGSVVESKLEGGQVVLAYSVDPRIPYSSMGQVELDVHQPRPVLEILPAP